MPGGTRRFCEIARGALVAAVISACGGGDDGRAPDAGGPQGAPASSAQAAELLDGFARAYCDAARACCVQAGADAADALQDCEAEVARQFDFFESIRGGRTRLLEPGFSQLIAALQASEDDCRPINEVPGGPLSLFQGTVPEGGACTQAEECKRGADPVACLKIYDTGAAGAAEDTGTCRTLARARAGEPCLISASEDTFGVSYSTPDPDRALAYCDERDGLYCSFPDDTCAPFASEGAACDADECAPGFYCDDTCQRAKPKGEDCASSSECEIGLTCDQTCHPVQITDGKICQGDFT